jgi:hypothetical protein
MCSSPPSSSYRTFFAKGVPTLWISDGCDTHPVIQQNDWIFDLISLHQVFASVRTQTQRWIFQKAQTEVSVTCLNGDKEIWAGLYIDISQNTEDILELTLYVKAGKCMLLEEYKPS